MSPGCGSDNPGTKPTDAGPDKPPTDGSTEAVETMPNTDMGPDAITPVRLVLSATSLMLVEGSPTASIKTIEVSLDRPWSTPITVTLLSANPNVALVTPETLEFGIGERGPQMVAIRAVDDDDIVDSSTTITFSSLETGSRSVKVDVDDVDVQALLVFPTKVPMTEAGKTESISVRLAKKPASSVVVSALPSNAGKLSVSPATLTFNPNNYDTQQVFTLSAPADSDALNDKVNLDLTATGGVPPQQVAVEITDKDAVNLTVIPGSLAIGEKDSAGGTLYISLTLPPPNDVTVTVQSSNPNKATVSPATLTFTPGNSGTSQAVTVVPVADNDGRDETVNITFTASGITPEPAPKSVSVSIDDPDSQAVQIMPGAVAVKEGATTTFTVNLSLMPDSNLTLGVFSQNSSKIEVTPPLLSFSPQNYMGPQTVTVRSLQDDDLANDTINVTITGLVGPAINVPVTVTDDDAQQLLLVLPTPGDSVIMSESRDTGPPSTAAVGVRLAFRPSAPVTVTLSGATAKLTLSRTSLTFLPGDFATTQFVTLTAPRDQDMVNDNVELSVSATGLTTVKLPVLILDEDIQNFQIAETNLGPLKEGKQGDTAEESATFTVKLKVSPAAPVTAAITSSKPNKVTTDAATCMLTAENYTTGCVIKVTAVEDADTRDEAVTITVADTAGTPIASRTVGVTVDDQDTQSLIVVADAPVAITEGQSGTFTVKLAADPVDSVTVNAFSQNPGRVEVAPPILTFSSANFDMPQTVTLNAIQDDDVADETVSVTLTSLVTANAGVTAAVNDDDTQAIILIPTPPGATLEMQEGGTSPLGVRLAFRPKGEVKVALTVTRNPGNLGVNLHASPTMVTFGPGNGVGNFSATQFVTLSADEEIDVVNEVDTVTAAATVTEADTAIANATQGVVILDNDVLNFSVTGAPTDPLLEGGMTTFTVKLSAVPPAPVTALIGNDKPGKADVTFEPSLCTLATLASSCTVKIVAKQDDDTRDEMVAITITDMAGTLAERKVGVVINDNDAQALAVTAANPVVVAENLGAGTFSLRLAADPIDSVTVVLSATVAGQLEFNDNGTFKSTMNFVFDTTGGANPWNVDKIFQIRGLEDLDLLDQNLAVKITLLQVLGVPDAFVNVRKTDNDAQEVILTESESDGVGSFRCPTVAEPASNAIPPTDAVILKNAGSSATPLLVEEGTDKTFCVSLRFKPDATTTVSLAALQSPLPLPVSVGINFSLPPSPTTRAFTSADYFKPQLVTIRSAADANLDDDLGEIVLSVPPVLAKSVHIRIHDKDSQRILIKKGADTTMDADASISLTEGAAGVTVKVALAFIPTKSTSTSTTSEETITISPSSDKIKVTGPVGLGTAVGNGWTFTATDATFSQFVSFDIDAVSDGDAGNELVSLVFTSSHGTTEGRTIAFTVIDDDQAAQFVSLPGVAVLPGNSTTITEGTTGTVGLLLAFDPVSSVTVTCSSAHEKVAITDNPKTYTFTGGSTGNWNMAHVIHLEANHDDDLVDDSITITCTAPGGLMMGTFTVVNEDNDVPPGP